MRNLIFYVLFFLLIGCSLNSQKNKIITVMTEEVTYLSSDQLEGRETGTQSEKMAADYISSKFANQRLSQKGTDGYFQYFDAEIKENPHSKTIKKKIKGINVIGYLDNQQEETIIIGAHYDHLGYGNFGSRYDGGKEIHNGADDNASGVSILINLANSLKTITNYNYLFIAFSGEEHGLFGSSFYAKNPTINLDKVRFMINFDMVGRLNNDKTLAINGVGTSSHWKDLITKTNKFNFNLKTSDAGIGPSDHTSFYLQDIPAIHFFTGQHEDYHKPSDDVDKINFEGMYSILQYVQEIILESTKIKNFDFIKTKSDSTTTPKFKVTLGIMPDYLYDGDGLRIDGVTKNKVADRFGILKGDIIIQLGEIQVTDIYNYMEGLSKYNTGDNIIIKLKRDDKILEVGVIF